MSGLGIISRDLTGFFLLRSTRHASQEEEDKAKETWEEVSLHVVVDHS